MSARNHLLFACSVACGSLAAIAAIRGMYACYGVAMWTAGIFLGSAFGEGRK